MGDLKETKNNIFLLIIILLVFYLCSEVLYADDLVKNRPVAVMIGNSPKERNIQKGIEGADIIYEIEVEYPFTRLMALYFGDNETVVGPIRSSRYYFSRISIEWSPIFVHCGGQNLKNENVLDIDELSYHFLFWRDEKIGGWINLFTDISKLKKQINKDSFLSLNNSTSHNLLNFNVHSLNNKNQVNRISIKYNEDYIISYQYDPYEKLYYHYINNASHAMLKNQKKIKVSNIIIQYVPIEKIKGDELGRVQVELIGEGIGKYFHSGDYQPIKWIKQNKYDQTYFFDSTGSPIVLNKGLTWIYILSLDNEVWFK
ncbi:MAG: DUF3048 domain-containing protein [Atribacterota bacterium]|nr:DUF3048 domain-containing protein [Atribacterota bacterium]MDD4896025.1 DUF3048 domain-containing protein [Atribacterota bacterium]MDD5638042.1 DUF3048 domain-containing protein [Atribacterota bacterium]